jgi:hypothetical protein
LMLAFTVQFSRYGRSRHLIAAYPGAATAVAVTARGRSAECRSWPWPAKAGPAGRAKRPFPQDPTACSARPPPADTVPSRRSGCTGCATAHEPNSQCSTSEQPLRDVAVTSGVGPPGGTAPG